MKAQYSLYALLLAIFLLGSGCRNFTEEISEVETEGFDKTEVIPFTIYMSPYGNDAWSGLSMGTALKTLAGVQAKLKQYMPTLDQDVEVRIRFVNGVPYTGQSVDWTYYHPDHTISFMPSDYHYGNVYSIAGRPVFDGNGKEDWWFDLRADDAQPTNIRFYYLKIQEYTIGGIRLYGNRNNFETGWNGYNTIYGCYFNTLGNYHNPGAGPGFGGVDLVNSDYNLIRNNHFISLVDLSPDGALMHGVYLAHNSDHNDVLANNFQWISGDPIRVRDFSNYNKILSNKFYRTGVSAIYSDWHYTGECRSWLNQLRDNYQISCSYSGGWISLFAYFDSYSEGSDCDNLKTRLSTSGNDTSHCP